jgi:hypothetical protein
MSSSRRNKLASWRDFIQPENPRKVNSKLH